MPPNQTSDFIWPELCAVFFFFLQLSLKVVDQMLKLGWEGDGLSPLIKWKSISYKDRAKRVLQQERWRFQFLFVCKGVSYVCYVNGNLYIMLVLSHLRSTIRFCSFDSKNVLLSFCFELQPSVLQFFLFLILQSIKCYWIKICAKTDRQYSPFSLLSLFFIFVKKINQHTAIIFSY